MFNDPFTFIAAKSLPSGDTGSVSYLRAKLPGVNPESEITMISALNAAAEVRSRTFEQIVDSLAVCNFLFLNIEGQCYTTNAATTLATNTSPVGAVKCMKTGQLALSDNDTTLRPTLNVPNKTLDFASDSMYYPGLNTFVGDFEAMLVHEYAAQSVSMLMFNNSSLDSTPGSATNDTFWSWNSSTLFQTVEAFCRPGRNGVVFNIQPTGTGALAFNRKQLYHPRNVSSTHYDYTNTILSQQSNSVTPSYPYRPYIGWMRNNLGNRQYSTFKHSCYLIVNQTGGFTVNQRNDIIQFLKAMFGLPDVP